MTKLTATHLAILDGAIARDDGLAVRPVALKPAGAAKIAARLLEQGLVRELRAKDNMPVWREDEHGKAFSLKILKAGREAVQAMAPQAAVSEANGCTESKVKGAAVHTINQSPAAMHPSAARPGSKRAMVLALLSRNDGATIHTLMEATGWLPHTTRAALSVLRKGGLTIERSRTDEGGASVYRIHPPTVAAAAA